MEAPDAIEKLRQTSKVLAAFKAEYGVYCKKSATATPQRPWHFQPGALFGRLDAFEERCRWAAAVVC